MFTRCRPDPLARVALVAGVILSLVVVTPANPRAADSSSPDEIVVRWREQVPDRRPRVLSLLGVRRPLSSPSLEVVEVPEGRSVEAAAAEVARHPGVLFAEPNHSIELLGDPDFERQWGLHNRGQKIRGATSRVDVDLDAPEAWSMTKGEAATVVAVIDTGVDTTHPDLQQNIWVNQAEADGTPGVDDDDNGYVDDLHGWDFYHGDASVYDGSEDSHGTHVAGIVAASENGAGTIGVAPEVTILPLKFLGSYGGTLAGALEAIDYASRRDVDVINASWSTTYESDALRDALAKSGAVVTAAAGNDGRNLDTTSVPLYPAAYDLPNLLTVAAVDNEGGLASFSNYGKKTVAVGAPGLDVWSTLPDGRHGWASGTSMAAPHVAGTAALLHSVVRLSPEELVTRIVDRAHPLAALRNKISSGAMANAAASLPSAPLPGGATLLSGDWNGDGSHETGFRYRQRIVLQHASGAIDSYVWGRSSDVPVSGDWNGDGVDTLGLYRDGCFFYTNRPQGQRSDGQYCYGTTGDIPIVGDWSGNGMDTLSLIRPSTGTWHLRDKLAGGKADWVFRYGRIRDGDIPLTGDWNGDGKTEVGVIRGNHWLLNNVAHGGVATWKFKYGRFSDRDRPVTGDWDGDGASSPGVVRDGVWRLRNKIEGGHADRILTWSASRPAN